MFCPALRSWTDGFCRPRSGLCSNLSVGGGQRGIVLFQTTQLVFAARAAMTWLVAPGSHGGLGGHREQCTSLAVAATARDGSARRVPLRAPATGIRVRGVGSARAPTGPRVVPFSPLHAEPRQPQNPRTIAGAIPPVLPCCLPIKREHHPVRMAMWRL